MLFFKEIRECLEESLVDSPDLENVLRRVSEMEQSLENGDFKDSIQEIRSSNSRSHYDPCALSSAPCSTTLIREEDRAGKAQHLASPPTSTGTRCSDPKNMQRSAILSVFVWVSG